MRIHVIRHTTPNIASGICYGQSDIDVCDSFLNEVQQIQQKLRSQYDILYTSPLQRCTKLSEHIKAKKKYQEEALKEYHFGDWEQTPWSQLTSKSAKKWMANFVDISSPNGESVREMQTRVLDFFHRVLNREEENIALITHAGVQRILFTHIMQSPLKNMFRLQLAFGTVLEINIKHQQSTIAIL